MRLVIDTNLLIRALLSAGPARRFIQFAPLHHQLLYNEEQLAELHEVASRPRLHVSSQAVDELTDRIKRYGRLIHVNLDTGLGSRDPKDDYLLAIALAGKADLLLSEDDDLLALNPWRGIRIMRLFQFLNKYPIPEF